MRALARARGLERTASDSKPNQTAAVDDQDGTCAAFPEHVGMAVYEDDRRKSNAAATTSCAAATTAAQIDVTGKLPRRRRRGICYDENDSCTKQAATVQGQERPKRKAVPASRNDVISHKEEMMLRRALRNSMAIKQQAPTLDHIPEAVVFRPTLDEFKDPTSYLEKIKPQAEKTGICKIIPPQGWRPPFSFNASTRFRTRKQMIHRLQEGEGFGDGRIYNMLEYEAMAKKFEQEWIEKDKEDKRDMADAIEAEFWSIVETSREPVEVEYGSDQMVGTGFPLMHKDRDSPYASSPWNLVNLPRYEGSLLRHLVGTVPGVTAPWLYFGMLFAAFCFHTEDDYMYSFNYHHLGAPKTWYGVPAAAAGAFERAMRQEVPALFEDRPDLLHQLVTTVSPAHLRARKVPVYRLRQEPGEFVITFPQAYHAGFNNGFNCAEAVNFAPPDWLPFGAAGIANYRRYCKKPVLNFHEMLCTVTRHKPSPKTAQWLLHEVKAMVREEEEARISAAVKGSRKSKTILELNKLIEQLQCLVADSKGSKAFGVEGRQAKGLEVVFLER
eukprot:SM000088S23769  [mRNA]  locus=s88:396563:401364:- [translate_table: standard]